MDEAKLAGISPYVTRLSAHYAALGIGSYHPQGYAWFDRVEVRVLMPWAPSEQFTQSALVLVVEFFFQDTKARYVEFRLSPTGFGGAPILRSLPGQKQPAHEPQAHEHHPAGDEPPG